ncbi:VCBS repeat-containing protein [Puia sp.]|uniref:VCBS repeat-containing protein n=1 Tax=Puia sp. TaxID=2045100 RepID=UPI002F3EF38C
MIFEPTQLRLLSGILFGISTLIAGCHPDTGKKPEQATDPLFVLHPPESTHVQFENQLTEGLNTNVLLYEYFYNGGGVAIADVNGDGWEDLYFTGNMTDNKLYLNKGNWQFEDVTEAAGVAGRPGPWKTGVCIADVNGDGRPDIYLCYSGKVHGDRRVKQLFINEGPDAAGIPHFSEQAARYGLADSAYTTQAYFFDYDRDGDLDLLELNHNPQNLPMLNEVSTAKILQHPSPLCGVRLLRNDGGHFQDVTVASGLTSSELSYGLGAGIADIDGDGWPDIYISNDYAVPDYLYINRRDGHFDNRLTERIGHTSQFSMGNAVADVNNDGRPDIFTLDMLPEDNHRQKLLFAPDNYEKFDLNLRSGFYYQYMRNMLQLNNGDGSFSEIGQLAGVSGTDWSWAPLWADYDNDGWKDLFVTNGYVRDYTNMDFIKFMESYTSAKGRLKREDVLDIVDHMPSSNVTSYLFKSDSGVHFSSMGPRWGLETPSNSNGAAWADLDHDGDLDLVVNNLNKPAFLYENRAVQLGKNHWLEVRLKGAGMNTAGIGTRLTLYEKGRLQYLEQEPAQGYQSCVSPILHFGLGATATADSLRIVWPDGGEQMLTKVAANQTLTLDEKDASPIKRSPAAVPGTAPAIKTPAFHEVASPITVRYSPPVLNDYKRQPQLVSALSYAGPCMARADVNGDGIEDLFVGGESGQPGKLFLGRKDGAFTPMPIPALAADSSSEDADALFFDANGDGHPDLYVASGGYHHFEAGDARLQDRLYLGDGKGHFARSTDALPVTRVAKSCVRMADVNGDGYPDLFVGGRVIPGRYPQPPSSFLLINDGKGHFTDHIADLAPALQKAGMITDAAWADLDGNGKRELIVVGEWMPVRIFRLEQGRLTDHTTDYLDREYSGWWNRLLVADMDKDGKPDIILGNLGLNAQCRADEQHPVELYYRDFDGNGTIDPVLCTYIGDTSYPFMTRDELIQQVSNMSQKFPDYKSYADARLTDIFPAAALSAAGHLRANCLRTVYLQRGAKGRFQEKPLPLPAQYSPVFTITALDYDGDGNKDLLLCGNITHSRLRFGKYDANYGVLLKGDGKGNFRYIEQPLSGFHLRGDVRSVMDCNGLLLFGINGEGVRAYKPAAAPGHP